MDITDQFSSPNIQQNVEFIIESDSLTWKEILWKLLAKNIRKKC